MMSKVETTAKIPTFGALKSTEPRLRDGQSDISMSTETQLRQKLDQDGDSRSTPTSTLSQHCLAEDTLTSFQTALSSRLQMLDLHRYGTSTGKLRLLEPDKTLDILFTSNQMEVVKTWKSQEPIVTGGNSSNLSERTLSMLKERPSMSIKVKIKKDKTSSCGSRLTV